MTEREQIAEAINTLLSERAPGKTICPSEAARMVYAADTWCDEMALVWEVSAEMAAAGVIEVCQKGEVIDITQAKGPIRLRKVQK